MRQAFAGAVLLALALTLGGCFIVVPSVTVSNLSVTTNQPDGNGGYYICTDQPTQVNYTFNYQGPLQSWDQKVTYLDVNGNSAGQSNALTLPDDDPNHAAITSTSASYSFVVNVPGNLTGSSQAVNAQSIVTQVGTAYLNINASGAALKSSGIQVVSGCP